MLSRTKLSRPLLGQRSESELRDQSPSGSLCRIILGGAFSTDHQFGHDCDHDCLFGHPIFIGTPVTVSSAWSSLDDPANYAFHPTIDSPRRADDGSIEFSFDTTLGRAPDGGDFMGLAADALGTFHPFWIDMRTGTFQAWTSAVRVGQQTTEAHAGETDSELNRQLRAVFDPTSYDSPTGTETIPVRFQNISDRPVCSPLFAVVEDTEKTPHQTPRILNAENDKDWAGAYFDYSSAFRDLPCLAPGQITEAIPWRIQPLASERTYVTIRVALSYVKPKQ
jgi:hypothetical protein